MDLATVLSDKPLPARTETTERASDVKEPSRIEVDVPLGAGPDDAEDAAPSAAKEPEAKVEVKAETKAEDSARDEKGRFQKTVPQEALHAERQRRQAAEAELAKAREAKPPPSVLDDEDAAFQARLEAYAQPIRAQLFELSIETARSKSGREDYEDVTQNHFLPAIDNDPELKKAWLAHKNPGEFAYSTGKYLKEMADVGGDITKYGEKKKAEGAAEAEALKTQLAALQAEVAALKASKDKQAKVPQSLNSEQSAAGKETQFAGPRPIKSILFS